MTLQQYLQEDGAGGFKRFRVPDLVPANGGEVELLLVVESPHVDELRTGLPLAGDAGQRALAFLSPTGQPPEALGPKLASLDASGALRIGVMNVSPVPLQLAAFVRHPQPPTLTRSDWDVLEMVRSDRASTIASLPTSTAKNTNGMLLPGLQARLDGANLSANAVIFIAGNFVHRTWGSLAAPPNCVVLPIPHPSMGWWTGTTRKEYLDNLDYLKTRFARVV